MIVLISIFHFAFPRIKKVDKAPPRLLVTSVGSELSSADVRLSSQDDFVVYNSFNFDDEDYTNDNDSESDDTSFLHEHKIKKKSMKNKRSSGISNVLTLPPKKPQNVWIILIFLYLYMLFFVILYSFISNVCTLGIADKSSKKNEESSLVRQTWWRV